jgi:hypothetical protein
LRKILRRAAVLAVVPAAFVMLSVPPAGAMESLGLVEVTAGGSGGSVSGDCTWTATLPSIGSMLEADTTELLAAPSADSYVAPEQELDILDFNAQFDLPGGDIDRIWIAFSGKARAVSAKGGGVAVSTSVRCYLRYQAWGSAGLTAVGPAAAISGEGEVYRLAPDPEICVVVSAAFSDGYVVPPKTQCHNL